MRMSDGSRAPVSDKLCHMAFDDLARRLGARPGVGGAAGTTDPDQIIAEAQSAARRAAQLRDLVLGPLLLAGALLVMVLWISITRDAATTRDPRNANSSDLFGYSPYVWTVVIGASIVGLHKILRGIGLVKR